MPNSTRTNVGAISWVDLTVDDAEKVRRFYSEVVGWTSEAVAMEGYDDFNMIAPGGTEPAAGICHARGDNADLPPQWVIYINVADMAKSIERCEALGGRLIVRPRNMGDLGRYCVIQDPAGAVAALWESARRLDVDISFG